MVDKTAIVDSGRCFVMNLDRNEISPPQTLYDVITKIQNGYYEKERKWLWEEIQHDLMITDILTEAEVINGYGMFIPYFCKDKTTYKLEPIELRYEDQVIDEGILISVRQDVDERMGDQDLISASQDADEKMGETDLSFQERNMEMEILNSDIQHPEDGSNDTPLLFSTLQEEFVEETGDIDLLLDSQQHLDKETEMENRNYVIQDLEDNSDDPHLFHTNQEVVGKTVESDLTLYAHGNDEEGEDVYSVADSNDLNNEIDGMHWTYDSHDNDEETEGSGNKRDAAETGHRFGLIDSEDLIPTTQDLEGGMDGGENHGNIVKRSAAEMPLKQPFTFEEISNKIIKYNIVNFDDFEANT